MTKYYCFKCGNDIKQKRIDSIKCFKCGRKGAKIKHDMVDKKKYYYLVDRVGSWVCDHKTFNKNKFKATKKVELVCPICKYGFLKVPKEKHENELKINTEVEKRKFLTEFEILLTKTELMYSSWFGCGRSSELVRKLQLKIGDKLTIIIRKKVKGKI